MPDTAGNKDIEFQPPVKGYSYSSSDPVASKPPTNPNPQNPSAKKNSGKSLNTIFTLVFSVLGFLFLFFIFLMVLNYFNIVSLNSINPTLFGRLPKALVIEKTPPPVIPSFEKLANQATKDQMLKYLIYMKTDSETLESLDPLMEISNGAFSGYNNDTIQITTTDKVMNFLVASETAIFKIEAEQAPDPSSSATASLKVSPNYTFLELVKKIKFGDILQVSYMKTNPKKATEIIFRANHQAR